jgi:FAD dependent oxidoreductase TIGR03364
MSAPGAQRVDLVIAGAGIVGLAFAVDATDRGLRVAVVERDDRPRGASIRNFGHGYVSAQSGAALEYAREARERWWTLAAAAGFPAVQSGTLLVARWPEELEVIREFVAERPDDAVIVSPTRAIELAPIAADGLLGALWSASDFRVDPRRAAPAIARWLADERAVDFWWRTTALAVEPGRLSTSRGELEADGIVLAVGHDLDRLLPEVAEEAAVRRCGLQMLRVALADDRWIEPALATGLALLRYSGFAACPSLPALRARYAETRPELLEHEVNLLVTQLPDGELIVGDTHRYGPGADPFRDEALDALVLAETRALLGVDELTVRERWLGVYAHRVGGEFLVSEPCDGVRAVVVTSGIGMTTALGLAPRVLAELLDPTPTRV